MRVIARRYIRDHAPPICFGDIIKGCAELGNKRIEINKEMIHTGSNLNKWGAFKCFFLHKMGMLTNCAIT